MLGAESADWSSPFHHKKATGVAIGQTFRCNELQQERANLLDLVTMMVPPRDTLRGQVGSSSFAMVTAPMALVA